MKYLFVHDAYPGQFIHLLRRLHGREGVEIVAASRKGSSQKLPVKQFVYDLPDSATLSDTVQSASAIGLDLFRQLQPLAKQGYHPDCIVSHASSGAGMYLRELFPKARFTSFLEWYYQNPPAENIDDEQAFHQLCAANSARNSVMAAEFEVADAAYAPTVFQWSQFPARWQQSISVAHEGIDTGKYKPDPNTAINLGGVRLTAEDEVITYAARGMERTRGFPQFMQAIAEVQKRRPQTHVLIAGADRQCYDPGGRGKAGLKVWAQENVDYDPARTHFVGLLREPYFIKILQVSSLHTYLSIPFVLSWSCLNAMSVGVPVLASDNAPVHDVIKRDENGVLVNSESIDDIVDRMMDLLDNQPRAAKIGAAGRQTILENFELEACVDQQLKLIRGA